MTVSTEARVKQLKTVWQLKGRPSIIPIVNKMTRVEIRVFAETFGIEPRVGAIVEYVDHVCTKQMRIVNASLAEARQKLESELSDE